jgi:two-component system invasion response regulator UvrY
MSSEIVTIGLVDDHTASRKGLALFLQSYLNCQIILHAGNGLELQEAFKKLPHPHILLLDVAMPKMNGLETMRWLFKEHPDQKAIIYTGSRTTLTMELFYSLGVRAILKKCGCEKELTKAITRVHKEGYYYNDISSRRLLMQAHVYDAKQKLKPLISLKEERFMKLLASGMIYEQIADRMVLSTNSINKIRNELFQKLDCKNRTELALLMERNGLAAGGG